MIEGRVVRYQSPACQHRGQSRSDLVERRCARQVIQSQAVDMHRTGIAPRVEQRRELVLHPAFAVKRDHRQTQYSMMVGA